MQKADACTIGDIGIPSMVLMERAALKTVEVMEQEEIDLSRMLVVCGSGNNGGDGFAIARLLKKKGSLVTVLFAGKETSMSTECACQKKIAGNMGIPIVTTIDEQEYTGIADAVFGVGLSREITGHYREVIDKLNQMSGAKVAVDIPSGISSFTGEVLGTAFQADLTVTFACEKLGSVLDPGRGYAGKVVPVEIGIETGLFEDNPEVCYTLERKDLEERLPKRRPDSHKGTFGKVLMVTGSKGMSGAAYLSAKAAYMVGAGLVQIYTAEENRIILQQLLPEAIISTYTEYAEEELKGLLKWADVVCVGCGLGQSRVSEQLLEAVIRDTRVPCVADADGLNLLSRHMELLKDKTSPVVLTPHMKEMSRLRGCSVEDILKDRFGILKEFIEEYNAVCVLKDARTVTADRGRQMFVNTAGCSAMAKAGSGDVLAGVITGLLAQHMNAYESAVLGVHLHASAGDAASAANGSYSVLAEDLFAGMKACIRRTEGE